MRLPALPSQTARALRHASVRATGLFTPTLRLGVTGLARAGKTVFITALVRSLVTGGRLPFFAAHEEGRILRAYLEPQPDDSLPRFEYETHLASLARSPPEWPDSTRRISQLRVTVEYLPSSRLMRYLGPARLHIDIVDYPGEWLIDLPMLEQSFAAWSAEALRIAHAPKRSIHARPWLDFLGSLDPLAPQNEQVALEGSRLFTRYLNEARQAELALSTAGPGRFLMPGDLEGSPLLTFFPLQRREAAPAPSGSLAAMLDRRYESYKTHVVRPFFRDHFRKLDRQIVLVDALGAVNQGREAIEDMERALAGVLQAFRPGATSWLSMILGRRIDRLVFAATKADHLHHTSHDRLEAILRFLTDRAIANATGAGADIKVLALASLRSTREAHVVEGGAPLHVVIGVPMPGESVDGIVFDGLREAGIFPGDLPEDPRSLVDGDTTAARSEALSFVRFRPLRVPPPGPDGEARPMPHIRLDRALDFLIGDALE